LRDAFNALHLVLRRRLQRHRRIFLRENSGATNNREQRHYNASCYSDRSPHAFCGDGVEELCAISRF